MAKKQINDHGLLIGMSGSGKSTLATGSVVQEADRGDTALVIEDPHPKSLAQGVFEQLVARGHGPRILYDRLYDLDHCLGYDFLEPSTAKNPLRRTAENEMRIQAFIDILLRRRGQASLAANPLTEQWTLNAGWLYVEQQPRKTLDLLYHVFEPKDATLAIFLDDCRDPERAARFKSIYDGKMNRTQYAAAQRLVSSVCRSPAFALRCGASFDFTEFLNNKGILIVEGGSKGTLSQDALRIMLGSISLKTLDYVRNRERPFPRISHYLDEANNVNLIGEHECRGLAELRKENYGCKILVQTLDFPNAQITESVLNNTATHIWFCCSSAKLAQQAAADLGDPSLKESLRSLRVGQCYIKTPGQYRRYQHQLSEDPWVFPGLAAKKAEAALKTIRQRSEYRNSQDQYPQAMRSQSQDLLGDNETPSSDDAPDRTPAPSNTTSICSPAERLRIADSQSSAKKDASDTSEA